MPPQGLHLGRSKCGCRVTAPLRALTTISRRGLRTSPAQSSGVFLTHTVHQPQLITPGLTETTQLAPSQQQLPEPLPSLSIQDLQGYLAQHVKSIPSARLLPPTTPVPREDSIKSLVYIADGHPLLVVVLLTDRVDERKMAKFLQISRRRLRMASPEEVLLHGGYAIGSVPPFGECSSVQQQQSNGYISIASWAFLTDKMNCSVCGPAPCLRLLRWLISPTLLAITGVKNILSRVLKQHTVHLCSPTKKKRQRKMHVHHM